MLILPVQIHLLGYYPLLGIVFTRAFIVVAKTAGSPVVTRNWFHSAF